MKLREKVIDAMWEKNVFPEQRADNILKLLGVTYEDKNDLEIDEFLNRFEGDPKKGKLI
jgi:hypothetical protein